MRGTLEIVSADVRALEATAMNESTEQSHAQGVMAMLVKRFEGQQLTRLLELKSAVDSGALLGDESSSFLAAVCQEAKASKHLVDRHPEYQPLYARAVRLYRSIAEQALRNEQAAQPRDAESRVLN
jgi:hypothetical protein